MFQYLQPPAAGSIKQHIGIAVPLGQIMYEPGTHPVICKNVIPESQYQCFISSHDKKVYSVAINLNLLKSQYVLIIFEFQDHLFP